VRPPSAAVFSSCAEPHTHYACLYASVIASGPTIRHFNNFSYPSIAYQMTFIKSGDKSRMVSFVDFSRRVIRQDKHRQSSVIEHSASFGIEPNGPTFEYGVEDVDGDGSLELVTVQEADVVGTEVCPVVVVGDPVSVIPQLLKLLNEVSLAAVGCTPDILLPGL